MEQHKHAEVIHKWAEGYPVQKLAVLCCDTKVKHWEDMGDTTPMWIEDQEYRIAPSHEEEVAEVDDGHYAEL